MPSGGRSRRKWLARLTLWGSCAVAFALIFDSRSAVNLSEEYARALTTARQKADRHGAVTLLYLNDAYVRMTRSFLCNLQALNSSYIDSLLVLSTSSRSAGALKKSFPKLSLLTIPFSKNQALGFNDLAYYELTAERLRILNMFVQSGLNVFTVEADAVWFTTDVLDAVLRALARYEVVSADDFFLPGHKNMRMISAGFMACRSTNHTRQLFRDYTNQYMLYLRGVKSALRKNEVAKVQGEQILLTKLLDNVDNTQKRGIKVAWLDGCSFVNGQWYQYREYQMKCSQPRVIQNNWIVGVHEKEARAKRRNHWFLAENSMHCATGSTYDFS